MSPKNQLVFMFGYYDFRVIVTIIKIIDWRNSYYLKIFKRLIFAFRLYLEH